MLLWRPSFDDSDRCARATSVLVLSRSCVCVSVGMCFERTLLPHQHAIAATFYVCVNVLIYFAQLPQCARARIS